MDLELTETQRLVRDTSRDYAQRHIAPLAARIDAQGEIARTVLDGLAELGLLAVNVPAELGGAEAGAVAYSAPRTEVCHACASTAGTMAVTNMVGEVIASCGWGARRARYNPRLADGRFIGAFALSEADAGSDPGTMRTAARVE